MAAEAAIDTDVIATAEAIQTAYRTSQMAKVIGLTGLAAGAVGVIDAFHALPTVDLDKAIKNLAAIIAMKAFIDDGNSKPAPSTGNGSTSGPSNAAEVEEILNARTSPGKTDPHREMGTDDEIRELYKDLTKDGKPMDVGTYPGEGSQLPDGTQIRIRDGSKSGGVTIDIKYPGMVAQITPESYSRAHVLDVIRELADRGYIRFGAFPGGGRPWEPWDVSNDESLQRIARGYNSVDGYLDIPSNQIGSNEVFRADLLERGEQRLTELGNPYEKYGDPWTDTPRRIHN
ncbi:hypothetical protein KO481_01145 [Nocardia sp. NEAU-G5]|uniref:Uncharacterized protein n=1 Tax=Nocardia albiluteola TaxID=2842303 RepID=A0ABS6ASZ0_9NOCA|nr:hypothetical protein [Nocardia albiluteola]MBU3060133.1 hypothetical protein [Nocardia albiluteola]